MPYRAALAQVFGKPQRVVEALDAACRSRSTISLGRLCRVLQQLGIDITAADAAGLAGAAMNHQTRQIDVDALKTNVRCV